MQSAGSAAVVLGEVRASSPARARYRLDIDGLRAISVLAVILFHGSVPGFAGGYVGVDVFFVISGYLITQILAESPEHTLRGQLRDFYARRCRRILPALFVVLLATAPLAWWLLLPGDLAHFGSLLGSTSVFAGNVVAWRSGGYFDPHPFDPLGHLWSLAVEEQFYVVFPLVFLAGGKDRSSRRLVLIAGCALASFALCVWASYTHPIANFFLVPTRAWELLLGSLVALGLGRSLSTHPLRGAAAGAALLALAVCVIAYDRNLRYPGLYALVPCASVAVLLMTGAGPRATRVGRWLGAPALVFVGLISYSLYLWHLPVIAFAAYYNIFPLEPRHLAILLPSISVLAVVTWRYVEAPIREHVVLASDARLLATAGAAALGVGLLGLLLWQSADRAEHSDAAQEKGISTLDRLRSDSLACAGRTPSDVANGSLCAFGPLSGVTAEVLVWGDSHATALLPAYEQIAFARNIRVHAAVRSSCRPLLRASPALEQRARRGCDDFNRAVVEALDRIDPALVILNAYWAYPEGVVGARRDGPTERDLQSFEAALDATLQAIGARRKVCIVGDVPTLKYRIPYAYVMARRRGIDPRFIALPSIEADQQLGRVNAYFEELRQHHALRFVDLKKTLCMGPTCALLGADGQSLYRDDNHLSIAGAEVLRPSVDTCFDAIE
jgi:peptidoglycan/LPS O-acetylase OafA/YrhL